MDDLDGGHLTLDDLLYIGKPSISPSLGEDRPQIPILGLGKFDVIEGVSFASEEEPESEFEDENVPPAAPIDHVSGYNAPPNKAKKAKTAKAAAKSKGDAFKPKSNGAPKAAVNPKAAAAPAEAKAAPKKKPLVESSDEEGYMSEAEFDFDA